MKEHFWRGGGGGRRRKVGVLSMCESEESSEKVVDEAGEWEKGKKEGLLEVHGWQRISRERESYRRQLSFSLTPLPLPPAPPLFQPCGMSGGGVIWRGKHSSTPPFSCHQSI